MEIKFCQDKIIIEKGTFKNEYFLNELNTNKLLEILESCVTNEEDISFSEVNENTPISHRLRELIEAGLQKVVDEN